MTWMLSAAVLLFLIAMVVAWAHYGLFNALLHLGVVIVGGALAFAMWEPLVVGFLAERMPAYAWGLGLLGPFALLLIILHVLVDKIARMNVQVLDIVNKIGGGAVGLVSGILTAGVLVLGIGFLPVPPAMMGYQPYSINPGTGLVEHHQSLWVPVDRMAAGFFTGLSNGAFSSGRPLATHQPELAMQSAIIRQRPDENSSIAAVPGTVKVDSVYTHSAQLPGAPQALGDVLGGNLNDGNKQIVVVATTWNSSKKGTYDGDNTLRVYPPQVRLVVQDADDNATLVAPFAMRAKSDTLHQEAYFTPVDSDRTVAIGLNQEEPIGFAFLIPANVKPTFLLARHLRLALPAEPSEDPAALIAALGGPIPSEEAKAESSGTPIAERDRITDPMQQAKAGHQGVEIELSDALPIMINMNDAMGLEMADGKVLGGKSTVKKGSSMGGPRTRVTKVNSPSHFACVRVKLKGETVHSLLGAARQSAALVNPIMLVDDQGNQKLPFAYVWHQEGDVQVIEVKSGDTFRSATEIDGLRRLRANEHIYLYFQVNKGSTIVSYQIGNAQTQSVDFPVPR